VSRWPKRTRSPTSRPQAPRMSDTHVPAWLVRDVDLLCLDAGNTVIFLDHERLARLVTEAGYHVSASDLVRSEGEAKARAEAGTLVDVPWAFRGGPARSPGARWSAPWPPFAGLDVARVPRSSSKRGRFTPCETSGAKFPRDSRCARRRPPLAA